MSTSWYQKPDYDRLLDRQFNSEQVLSLCSIRIRPKTRVIFKDCRVARWERAPGATFNSILNKETDIISRDSNVCIVHQPQTKVNLIKYLEHQKFGFDYTFDAEDDNRKVNYFKNQLKYLNKLLRESVAIGLFCVFYFSAHRCRWKLKLSEKLLLTLIKSSY